MSKTVDRRSSKEVYRSGGGRERTIALATGISIVVFIALDSQKWHLVRHALGPQGATAVGYVLMVSALVAFLVAFFKRRR